jgi:hypothetical protein
MVRRHYHEQQQFILSTKYRFLKRTPNTSFMALDCIFFISMFPTGLQERHELAALAFEPAVNRCIG